MKFFRNSIVICFNVIVVITIKKLNYLEKKSPKTKKLLDSACIGCAQVNFEKTPSVEALFTGTLPARDGFNQLVDLLV